MSDSATVVGRDAELARIHAACAAVERQGEVLLITGEAGLGKTRLTEEAAAAASAQGFAIVPVTCVEDLDAPYGPLVRAIRRLLRNQSPRDVAQRFRGTGRLAAGLFPEFAVAGALPRGQVHSEDLDTGLVELLLSGVSTERRLLVVVEDLHWADPDTARAVAVLGAEAAAAPVWLLVTSRLEELVAGDGRSRALGQLRHSARVEEIVLEPLGREATRALVLQDAAGAQLSESEVDEVVARCAGNPLYAEALARGTLSAHRTAPGPGAAAPLPQVPLPTILRDALLSPARRLSPDALRLVRLAAAAGERVDPLLLTDAGGWAWEDVAGWLEEALATRLLVELPEPEGTVQCFRHALVREAVYGDIPARDRCALHRGLGEALARRAETVATDGGAGARAAAEHLERAGLAERAGVLMRLAARRAVEMRALSSAQGAYRDALRLATDGRERLSLLVEAAEALVDHREPEVERYIAEGIGLAQALGQPLEEARLQIVAAIDFRWRDDPRAAMERGRRAVTMCAGTGSDLELKARLCLIRIAESDKDFDTAAAEHPGALELALRLGSAEGVFRLHIARGKLAKPSEALDFASTACDLARGLGPDAEHHALATAGLFLADVGRITEAIDYTERAVASGALVAPRVSLVWLENLSELLCMAGRYDEALDCAARVRSHGNPLIRSGAQAVTAETELRRGHTEAVQALMAGIEGRELGFDAAGRRLQALCLRARLLFADDDPAGVQLAGEALRDIERRCRRRLFVDPAHWWISADLARHLARHRQAEALAALVARIRPLTDPGHLLNVAALRFAEGLLAAVRDQRDLARRSLSDARDRYRAMPFPVHEAEACLALAEVDGIGAQYGEAVVNAQRALTIARDIGSPPLAEEAAAMLASLQPPARRGITGRDGGLTDRELEVARLVAAGLSNERIATLLCLSPHTVAHHVSHILDKLDLGNRAAIGRWVGEHVVDGGGDPARFRRSSRAEADPA